MRDLKISNSINLGIRHEFNHLRVSNLSEFLDEYHNNIDFYQSPFSILRNLEIEVMFEDHPDDCYLIPYKPSGDVMFIFESIEIDCWGRRIVTYSYNGTIV